MVEVLVEVVVNWVLCIVDVSQNFASRVPQVEGAALF